MNVKTVKKNVNKENMYTQKGIKRKIVEKNVSFNDPKQSKAKFPNHSEL